MSFWKFLGNMAVFSAIYKLINRHRGGQVNPGGGGNNGCGGLCYDPESMRLQSEISDIRSRLDRLSSEERQSRRHGNRSAGYSNNSGYCGGERNCDSYDYDYDTEDYCDHDDCGNHDDYGDCNGFGGFDNFDSFDSHDGFDNYDGYDDCDRDW